MLGFNEVVNRVSLGEIYGGSRGFDDEGLEVEGGGPGVEEVRVGEGEGGSLAGGRRVDWDGEVEGSDLGKGEEMEEVEGWEWYRSWDEVGL